jgi:hypothetical protein
VQFNAPVDQVALLAVGDKVGSGAEVEFALATDTNGHPPPARAGERRRDDGHQDRHRHGAGGTTPSTRWPLADGARRDAELEVGRRPHHGDQRVGGGNARQVGSSCRTTARSATSGHRPLSIDSSWPPSANLR